MSKRTRNLIIIAGALALLVVVAVVASRGKHADVAEVRLQKLSYTTFTVKLPENGVVMHQRAATIPALVGGNLGQIFVQAGSTVSQGELLATIYNPTIQYNAAGSEADAASASANISAAEGLEKSTKVGNQAQVDTNKSALDLAKRVYDEDVSLYANKAIPRNQLDTDKATLDQRQVAYDQSVQQLQARRDLRLQRRLRPGGPSRGRKSAHHQRSEPATGRLSADPRAVQRHHPKRDGANQRRAAPAYSPATQSPPANRSSPWPAGHGYIVRAQVDEQDIINVRLGMPVLVTGEDFPGKTIHGHVATIAPIATKSTDATSTAKQVLTTIQLDQNPPFLRDGMSADVDILTTSIPRSIVIPNDAITKEGGKSYVYVVQDGTARKRSIVTGKAGDTQTLVKSGLAAGDTIVAQKPLGITDGAKVKAMPSASPSPSAT